MMRKSTGRKLLCLAAACLTALYVCGCSGQEEERMSSAEPQQTAVPSSEASRETEPAAVPEPEEPQAEPTAEPALTPEDKELIIGCNLFSGRFSPFFALSQEDREVAALTGERLFGGDREGNMLLRGIEGETRDYCGREHFYQGIADCSITVREDGSAEYDVTLREDVTFSDGVPMTADDVIFTMYVLTDPAYDGSSGFYTLPIKGLDKYIDSMEIKGNLIVNGGPDNKDFTFFTKEEQEAYFAAMPEAGEAFAQDIIQYCLEYYSDYLDVVGGNEAALGMFAWGLGDLDEDGTHMIGYATGKEYVLTEVTAADLWDEIYTINDGDYITISNYESARSTLFYFMNQLHPEFGVAVPTRSDVASIEGIEKTGPYSVKITMEKYDPSYIYQLDMVVAPLHYYGDESLYDYEQDSFGFPKGDLTHVKEKNGQPLGAGPYVFEGFRDGTVTFRANEDYLFGAPKVGTLLLRETPIGERAQAVADGTVDLAEVVLDQDNLKELESLSEDGSVTVHRIDDTNYGYIGINAQRVKVGEDSGSQASRSLRKAFATLFSVYRESAVEDYFGGTAAVIQYPNSESSWAVRKPNEEGWREAYSLSATGEDIYAEGMSSQERYQAALEAAVEYLKQAGYTYDEETGRFTEAPKGAEMSYEIILPGGGRGDHPMFAIAQAASRALETVGIELKVNDMEDASVWNMYLSANRAQMWAAARTVSADPDIYATYHSDNIGTRGTGFNHYAIEDDTMDGLIEDARSSTDAFYRRDLYRECMDIIMDWAVEIPVYQKQNAIVTNTARLEPDGVIQDMTVFWDWRDEPQNLDVN